MRRMNLTVPFVVTITAGLLLTACRGRPTSGSTSASAAASTTIAPSETKLTWPKTATFARISGGSEGDRSAEQRKAFAEDEPRLPSTPRHLRPEPVFDPKVFVHAYKGPYQDPMSRQTTVFFLSDKNRFYVLENCEANHLDLLIGPFEGDPRIVLAP